MKSRGKGELSITGSVLNLTGMLGQWQPEDHGRSTLAKSLTVDGDLAVSTIDATGKDANIPLKLSSKGTGGLALAGNTTVSGSLEITGDSAVAKSLAVAGSLAVNTISPK